MKRLFQLLLVCFVLTVTHAFAQETVCNNYLDDDGDGFIDCFDSDCSTNSICDDFYLGNDAACQLPDPPSKKFTMTMDFSSPNETTNHLSRMAIGDLNRDGVPEIVTMNRYTKRLFILNGSDGSIQSQATVAWEPQWEIAIANLDNDGCAEIFFFGIESKSFFLYAYDCNLNFIWKSAQKLLDDPVNYGLADFDSDGRVELYAKDEIFDAHTGVRIVKSSTTTATNYNRLNGGPVAVDMDNDGKLELVIGLSIFKVNLGARTADVGSLTLFKKEPTYFVRYPFNATSVADYNLDGFLDVIASGSTIAPNTNTTVFFWDVQNNTVKTFSDPIPGTFSVAGCPASSGTFYKDGWQNGTGRVNLADLDGDGKMNASYVSGKFLYALKEDFTLLWRVPVNEETSGYTGCTLFDFNGDGQSEIVYRDEKFIYIINGKDGSVNTQQACVSRTNREYPIVADVDADGSTEICVTCGFNDALAVANFCNINYSTNSHIRAFKSASEPWVPARRLWNQHGYFNVNVNNDLTIPRVQQKHHIPFSAVPCKVGQNIIPRPLNNFLNQSPFLDSKGCQVNIAPDLGFVNNSLVVNSPTCPDQNFTVSFSIENKGDAPISGDLPITFYSGDPNQAGAIKLNTITVTLVALSLNDVLAVDNAPVSGPGSVFELYIVLNDDGSSVPTPIKLAPDFIECNYINNVEHATVRPLPVDITALKIQDNVVCSPVISPPNGAVRAFILTGGVQNTIDYNFYWSNGLLAKPIPADFTGATYSGLAAGDYTVYAVHKTANCGSDTATVVPPIIDIPRDIQVTIDIVSPDTDCKNPNGSLHANVTINGVLQPESNFIFKWTKGTNPGGGGQVLGNAALVANLLGDEPYAVEAIEKSSGCGNFQSETVPSNKPIPVVLTSTTDIVCSNSNSGAAAATVGGVTAGFTFNWYKGSFPKPTTDFPASKTTGVISSQPAGNYTVVVINNSTKCESNPVTVTIKQTPAFTVTINKTSNQTSCDMSQLNGAATATPSAGAVSDYSFEWFKGQNTLATNFIDSTSNTITGLDVGIYTVRAKNRITKCFDTDEVTINFAVTTPVITNTTETVSSRCSPPDGIAEVTLLSAGNVSDYTFEWYTGSLVDPLNLIADTDEKIENLVPGDYTVVATSTITHCVTPPKVATVGSIIVAITIDSTTINYPNKCDDFGSIEVVANAPGNTLGYDFVWHRGQEPFQAFPINPPPIVTSTSTTSELSQILTGAYTVVVTDRGTGCSSSRYFKLPFDGGQILFPKPAKDITTCNPGNGGELHGILVKPIIIANENLYDIVVYKGKNDLFPDVPYRSMIGAPTFDLLDLPGDPLSPGFYTFVGVLRSSGCRSVPLTMELKAKTLDPVFTQTILDNVNCPGVVLPSGQISLTISAPVPPDPVTTASDYDFKWYEGTTTATPLGTTTGSTAGINNEIAQNLIGGKYTVVVTANGPLYAGCFTTQTFQVFDNAPTVAATVSTIDKLDCQPISNAGASVATILENGVSKPFPSPDYPLGTFTNWLDSLEATLQTGGTSISNIAPANYFVKVTNTTNNCFSEVAFTIKDLTPGDPSVNLSNFRNPTSCYKNDQVPPGDPLYGKNILGELHVDAVGNAPTGFTFNWYAGPAVAGPILPETKDFTGIDPTTDGLIYTIEVVNNTTQCKITDTYTLVVEQKPIFLTASSSSLTFCNTPYDGSVFATVIGAFPAQYDYNWVDVHGKIPPFSSIVGTPYTPLDSGTYVVTAVDKDPLQSATCFATATVVITNERVFPELNVQPIRSLSVCDLTYSPADGVAEASIVGEDVINYAFDWYRDDLPPVGNLFANGTQVGGLADSTYYVVASHIVTGCSDSTSVTILKEPLPIPFPQIAILSQKTSCDEDNGALSASVGGNTKDYIFDWFRGKDADTTYLSTGEMIDSLSVDFYTVTATSRETGCVSVPVFEEIKEQIAIPDFNFKIEPATCDQEDGFLTLFMTTTDIEIASIRWVLPSGDTITSPNVVNAIAGTYWAIVTTALGCDKTKPIELLTEIKPYNGVSVNGDSKNPIFQIDCIQNFPDNVVKIFNRAGTLVYEASGYDNQVTFFDGKSNKGISLMGTQLPGGTYFYVIDKRDGSKAVAGYLEVVN